MAEDLGTSAATPDASFTNFSATRWEPDAKVYGVMPLLHCRAAMIARHDGEELPPPVEISHIKFLNMSGLAKARHGDAPDADGSGQPGEARLGTAEAAAAVVAAVMHDGATEAAEAVQIQPISNPGLDNEGPGQSNNSLLLASTAGTWWRASSDQEVVVREGSSLWSRELLRHPPGSYVLQAAQVETLSRGRERGILRMPVMPRGWVTLDATAAGGPRYFEMCPAPRWRVIHQSGTKHGDVLVRATKSLDSPEVGVLWNGDYVEQIGSQEFQESQGKSILRMPVALIATAPVAVARRNSLTSTAAAAQASPAERAQLEQRAMWAVKREQGCLAGWVTADATKAGGPRFFEECRLP